MSVDTYAVCPCGSGKKIKFCKCKTSIHEIDRVLKMVEGGQIVPALDRLTTVLAEHPDAAWALAIRGRLLIDLREYETLIENADRFIRLQPSNPMALAQRAAGFLFNGKVADATSAVLEALTETGREIDSFVLDVASVLALSQFREGLHLTARVYAMLAMTAQGYEKQNNVVELLYEMSRSPAVSMLVKSIPELIPRPADATWGERFDEAESLLMSHKIALAESKLQSLQRVAPGEGAVLSGLLMCAIWRGDKDAQVDYLNQLSRCESLPTDRRVHYRAMAVVTDVALPEIAVPVLKLIADVDSADEAEMALAARQDMLSLPRDLLQSDDAEQVRPMAVFQHLDRPKLPADAMPQADNWPLVKAFVLVFGKQTDRSAQVHAIEVTATDADAVSQTLQDALRVTEMRREEPVMVPLTNWVFPRTAYIEPGPNANLEQINQQLAELRRRDVPRTIADTPVPMLDHRSLADCRDEPERLIQRQAMMEVFLSFNSIQISAEDLHSNLATAAGLEPPATIHPTADTIEAIANEELYRVDPSGLDSESVFYLFQRCQSVGCTRGLTRLGAELIKLRDDVDNPQIVLTAYWNLLAHQDNAAGSRELYQQAYDYIDAKQVSAGWFYLSVLEIQIRGWDQEGFQKSLQMIMNKHSNDPEVMGGLQQMLGTYGLINRDGSPRGSRRGVAPAAAETSSGLWTPDAPAAAPAGGGSKLWVPGMD